MTADEANILTDYMKGVCEYGTGSGYFSGLSYSVAGKTGTAEFDNEGNCNSWFVGFSDPDDPDIVVCAITEQSNVTGVTGAWLPDRCLMHITVNSLPCDMPQNLL